MINHGNAGNQTKGPASATISKESGGLPHGKPREAPRKLRKNTAEISGVLVEFLGELFSAQSSVPGAPGDVTGAPSEAAAVHSTVQRARAMGFT